ncbi:MAG: hypothetical protein V3V92_02590 [Candidatus Hydrothermarchaeales archaeon]
MRIPIQRIIEAIEEQEYIGFCLNCGEEKYEVEPDAREYTCDVCGDQAVHGAEEILMMGEVYE